MVTLDLDDLQLSCLDDFLRSHISVDDDEFLYTLACALCDVVSYYDSFDPACCDQLTYVDIKVKGDSVTSRFYCILDKVIEETLYKSYPTLENVNTYLKDLIPNEDIYFKISNLVCENESIHIEYTVYEKPPVAVQIGSLLTLQQE